MAVLVTLMALAMFAGAEWIEKKLRATPPASKEAPKTTSAPRPVEG